MIGDRFDSNGNISFHSLKIFFDQNLISVREYLLNNYTNYRNINDTHVREKSNLIRILNDNVPIHINFDVGPSSRNSQLKLCCK